MKHICEICKRVYEVNYCINCRRHLKPTVNSNPSLLEKQQSTNRGGHSASLNQLPFSKTELLPSVPRFPNESKQLSSHAEHRLYPEVRIPTQKELDYLNDKVVYEKKNHLEFKNLTDRGEYARALDKLSENYPAIWKELTPEEKKESSKWSDLGQYFASAVIFYGGPKESGHDIWIRFQSNLRTLLTEAFSAGYHVRQSAIQKLIVEVALAKTLYESNGLGSCGRVDDRLR